MKLYDLLFEKKVNHEQDAVSPGVQQLKTGQYMGMYKFSKDVAGHDGMKQHAPESDSSPDVYKDAPVVVGYSDADDKKTAAAMKGKVKQTVDPGSTEPDNVNNHSPLSKKKGVAEGVPGEKPESELERLKLRQNAWVNPSLKHQADTQARIRELEKQIKDKKGMEEDKIKGKDGKACWKGYRYGGTEDGKDVCIKVQEATTLSHARYLRSHGKKASGGYGNWMFTSREYGEPSKDEIFVAPQGKFSDAAKLAAKWARANGHFTIYVMEAAVSEGVIYQLSKDAPMDDTEVLVLGGAGRYSLAGLRNKARREAAQLAKDLEVEHGGAFRSAAQHVKQLQNTLNTIVAAYDELDQLRRRGGLKSKGIRSEDRALVRESIEIMEKWTQKYKNSIDCSNPKGFSQKAHCAGRKK